MSWDAPPPGEPQQPTQPYGQPTQGPPTQPYGQPTQGEPTQPYFPTQSYDQPPPQWTQPQADQYGQPGQPGQYGDPYFPPYPLYPTAPPPKRSRTGFYVLVGAIAIVVAAGVAAAVAVTGSKSGNGTPSALSSSAPANTASADAASGANSSSTSAPTPTPASGSDASQSPRTVILPTSAGPLNLLSNADTARRIAGITSSLAGNAAYSNPKIGFYAIGSDSSFSVWMLAENSSDVPAFKPALNLLGDAAMARQIAQGAKMTNVTTESPGPLGGAVLCGKIATTGGQFRVCEWVDESSFGWVYFVPSVSSGHVLAYTLDLRSGAEQ